MHTKHTAHKINMAIRQLDWTNFALGCYTLAIQLTLLELQGVTKGRIRSWLLKVHVVRRLMEHVSFGNCPGFTLAFRKPISLLLEQK